MGLTLAEKILARASKETTIRPGNIVEAEVDVAMLHDTTGPQAVSALEEIGAPGVWNPEKVVVVLDHLVPAPHSQAATLQLRMRDFARRESIKHFHDINTGICHQVLAEKGYAKPGQVLVGTDSHTCTAGALGSFALGIGSTEMAAVLATGKLWFRVPATIRVDLEGKLPDMVTAKDIILHVIKRLGIEGANYRAVEFGGSTIKDLSVDERMTICNMVIEMGGKVGIVSADDITLKYLKERGFDGLSTLFPDSDACYEQIISVNVAALEPLVSRPFRVDNVVEVSKLKGVKIQQALLGTCTNGRLVDLQQAALILKGRKIDPNVRLVVVPASWEIYRQAMRDGTLEIIAEAGGVIINPGCGPCCGGHQGLLAPGEVCISTSNRNFVGRMGKGGDVYLASPLVVAISAVRGQITDPRVC